MLIRRALPRVRPPGNQVYRVRRGHRLAADAVAVILTGPPYGFARELVTGAPFIPTVGSPGLQSSSDGMAVYLTSGAALETVEAHPLWAVTGAVSIGWRGYAGNTNSPGTVVNNMPLGGNGGSATPYYFTVNNVNLLGRANGSGYRVWEAPNAYDIDNRQATRSVTQGGDISVAPIFYHDGAALGAAYSDPGNTGAGAATGAARPLNLGRRADGTYASIEQTTNIVIVAARQWDAGENLLFHLDPYGVIEETPRYFFSGPPPAAAARRPFIFMH